MPRQAYVNGRYVPHREAAVHIEDRGYQFADGVYEVVPVYNGILVDEDLHLDRLDRSLSELRIAEPMSRLDILRLFPKLRDGSHVSDPRVRFVEAQTVEIAPDPSGAALPPAFADGELVGATPLKVTVAPRALTVLGGRADLGQ